MMKKEDILKNRKKKTVLETRCQDQGRTPNTSYPILSCVSVSLLFSNQEESFQKGIVHRLSEFILSCMSVSLLFSNQDEEFQVGGEHSLSVASTFVPPSRVPCWSIGTEDADYLLIF